MVSEKRMMKEYLDPLKKRDNRKIKKTGHRRTS
jgi:hypothetical protein